MMRLQPSADVGISIQGDIKMGQHDGLDFGQDTADQAVGIVKSVAPYAAKEAAQVTKTAAKGTVKTAGKAAKKAAKATYKVVGYTVKNLQKFSIKDLGLTTQSFLSQKSIKYDQLSDDAKKAWHVEPGEKGGISKMGLKSVVELKSQGKNLKEVALPGKDSHLFDQIARKHNVSYSIIREPMLAADGSKLLSEAGKPLYQYHVLFKGKDGASMKRCFDEFGKAFKANNLAKASSRAAKKDIKKAVDQFSKRANEQAKHKKERMNIKTRGEQSI